MYITTQLVFDQFRNVFGSFFAVLIFACNMFPKKKNIARRMILLSCLLTGHALINLWNNELMNLDFSTYRYVGYVYLLLTACWRLAVVLYGFDAAFEPAVICVILGYTMEVIPTAFLRYVFIERLMPELETRHFGIYIGITLATYLAIYGFGWYFVAGRLRGADEYRAESKKPAILYLLVYAGMIVLTALLQTVMEITLLDLDVPEYRHTYVLIFYLCSSAMALVALIVQALFVYIYRATVLSAESRLLGQLLEDRGEQYSFLRENIDMINEKCHELKHRLRDLEVSGNEEHNRMLREIRDTVNFYEANVKTGNEMLDTILTEKSTLCAARGIKLICMANVEKGIRLGVVDLYAMLGECLDNAISFTMQNPSDRKMISFRVQPVGEMLYFSIENYYQGKIIRKNGLPLGADGKEHLRLVRRIARRNGGSVQITEDEGQVLMVQVILPEGHGGGREQHRPQEQA